MTVGVRCEFREIDAKTETRTCIEMRQLSNVRTDVISFVFPYEGLPLKLDNNTSIHAFRPNILYFLRCGTTAQTGPRPPLSRFLDTQAHTHTHTTGRISLNGGQLAEAATCTTHNKHKRLRSVPSAVLEPAIPAMERRQSYVLDRTATGIGKYSRQWPYILASQWKHCIATGNSSWLMFLTK